ncbi:GTP pyrophosphokinase family protein [uncultured Fibrella sp.]|uniref:GTP pyrophosphokinase n=1 Tax=uncultured Fibrella sp. TaxID=1284596 RepID=UPI0035CA1ACA
MDEQQLRNAFRGIKLNLESWGKRVDQIIKDVLDPLASIHRVQIGPQFRIKDEDSFIAKALYRNKDYSDYLLNIEDKIGTRVVMLMSEDVSAAADLLMQYQGWSCKVGKDHRNEISHLPNLFDYQSIHLTVWPKENTSEFPENVVNLLTCEIQIRTLLQHAYAEVSHDNVYKGPYKNDKGIQRKLAKSMALMESTDDYFCDIFKLMTNEQRPDQLFLGELTKRFRRLKPQAEPAPIDTTITDLIFGLLSSKQVSPADIDKFLDERGEEVVPYIRKNDSLLFNQPIILLVAYYLLYNQRFMEENWPLNRNALQSVKRGFGYGYN